MSRIDEVFCGLRAAGRKAFIPFITAGDPDLEFTGLLLQRLNTAGCHLAELGIPYSDPIADGPVIQDSYTRALKSGIRLNDIFSAADSVVPSLAMPVISMVSYAIICRTGIDEFLRRATGAGIAGAIVADLPWEESSKLLGRCRKHEFSLIQLISPTTERRRAKEIVRHATGFIYYVSITGITGQRADLPAELIDNLRWLKDQTELPICVGFGISQPSQIKALRPVVDGVIVGSAIVSRIAHASHMDRAKVADEVIAFVLEMMSALNN